MWGSVLSFFKLNFIHMINFWNETEFCICSEMCAKIKLTLLFKFITFLNYSENQMLPVSTPFKWRDIRQSTNTNLSQSWAAFWTAKRGKWKMTPTFSQCQGFHYFNRKRRSKGFYIIVHRLGYTVVWQYSCRCSSKEKRQHSLNRFLKFSVVLGHRGGSVS